jgi:hypothetical protein
MLRYEQRLNPLKNSAILILLPSSARLSCLSLRIHRMNPCSLLAKAPAYSQAFIRIVYTRTGFATGLEGTLSETCLLRPCKYLNNIIEQDHRFVKRRVNPGVGVWGVRYGTADHPGL